ncbi:hypothetical protein EPN42_10840 [bacterium]|nr:MAG: hypothetical protein EPN42_10840 [bacterium]
MGITARSAARSACYNLWRRARRCGERSERMSSNYEKIPKADVAFGAGAVLFIAILTACGGGGGGAGSPTIPPVGTPTPIPLQTQTPAPAPASASGTITDDSGTPISGASVALTPFQTPPPSGQPEPTMAPAVATTTTNASGAYSFSNVPAGTYLLSVFPQDSAVLYDTTALIGQVPDPANGGMGAYTSTHASLHEKIALASGSNGLGIDQVLRLTDNEVVCAQDFEFDRKQAGLSPPPVDSAALAAVRVYNAYNAANPTSDPVTVYQGVGAMQGGDYHTGTGCVGVVNPLPAQLAGANYAFVGLSTSNAGVYGPASGGSPVIYP